MKSCRVHESDISFMFNCDLEFLSCVTPLGELGRQLRIVELDECTQIVPVLRGYFS